MATRPRSPKFEISNLKFQIPNPLAVFHRRRGTPFWQTPNALWLPAGSFSLYAAPSSLPVVSDRREMESALRASNRLVALETATRPTGFAANAFILRDKNYGPHSLQRQFRQQVKKASQHCGVEPLDWPTLSRLGLPVNRALLARALIARPEVEALSTGRQTLPANPGLDRFKAHAGFTSESNNMAMHRDALLGISGFDETFRMASEDRNLCDRWRLAGRRLFWIKHAQVEHRHLQTPVGFCCVHFYYGRGAFFLKKNGCNATPAAWRTMSDSTGPGPEWFSQKRSAIESQAVP